MKRIVIGMGIGLFTLGISYAGLNGVIGDSDFTLDGNFNSGQKILADDLNNIQKSITDFSSVYETDKTKLDGIEDNATADQTDSEIKTAYENNSDTNAFTDSEKTKLDGIEDNATADMTDSEIKTAYENNSDTNAFTDSNKTKLDRIEENADVTDSTNVKSAGAVMNTGDESIGGTKTFDDNIIVSGTSKLGNLVVLGNDIKQMSDNDTTTYINYNSIDSSGTENTDTFRSTEIRDGKNNLIIKADGPTGNVGIGTDSPTEKLEVVGNTNLNGELNINDGTSNWNAKGNDGNLELSVNADKAFKIKDENGSDMRYFSEQGNTFYNDQTFENDINVKGYLKVGDNSINEISYDGTFDGNSDNAIPTEKAIKTYITDRLNTGDVCLGSGC